MYDICFAESDTDTECTKSTQNAESASFSTASENSLHKRVFSFVSSLRSHFVNYLGKYKFSHTQPTNLTVFLLWHCLYNIFIMKHDICDCVKFPMKPNEILKIYLDRRYT